MRLIILGAALLCGACTPGINDMTSFAKAMSGDPASVCFQVTTIYGVMTFARTNSTSAANTCGPATLSNSTGAAIVVPKPGGAGFEILHQ